MKNHAGSMRRGRISPHLCDAREVEEGLEQGRGGKLDRTRCAFCDYEEDCHATPPLHPPHPPSPAEGALNLPQFMQPGVDYDLTELSTYT